MLENVSWARKGLYVASVVAQVAAFFVGDDGFDLSWAAAMQKTANFLGGLAGMIALGNFASSPKGAQLLAAIRGRRARIRRV